MVVDTMLQVVGVRSGMIIRYLDCFLRFVINKNRHQINMQGIECG
jgi:hypothetical protein